MPHVLNWAGLERNDASVFRFIPRRVVPRQYAKLLAQIFSSADKDHNFNS